PPDATGEPGLAEDRLGKVRPRAVAGGCDVPDAALALAVDELPNSPREMPHVGRAATLVVHDRDVVALRAEREHRAHEVVTRRPEQPRGPHDPGLFPGRGLAEELRAAVGGEGIRPVR